MLMKRSTSSSKSRNRSSRFLDLLLASLLRPFLFETAVSSGHSISAFCSYKRYVLRHFLYHLVFSKATSGSIHNCRAILARTKRTSPNSDSISSLLFSDIACFSSSTSSFSVLKTASSCFHSKRYCAAFFWTAMAFLKALLLFIKS